MFGPGNPGQMDQEELRKKLMEFISQQGGQGPWGRGRPSRRSVGATGGRGQSFNPRPMPMLGRSPFSRQLARGVGGLMGPSAVQGGGTPGMGGGPPPGAGAPNVPNPGAYQGGPGGQGGPPTTHGAPVDYSSGVSPDDFQAGVAYPNSTPKSSYASAFDVSQFMPQAPDYETDPQQRQTRYGWTGPRRY